jgi:hypothetical protein
MRELEAAHAWGCPTPTAFDEMDRDDRTEVVAYYEARWRMDAVNAWEASRTVKPRKRRK